MSMQKYIFKMKVSRTFCYWRSVFRNEKINIKNNSRSNWWILFIKNLTRTIQSYIFLVVICKHTNRERLQKGIEHMHCLYNSMINLQFARRKSIVRSRAGSELSVRPCGLEFMHYIQWWLKISWWNSYCIMRLCQSSGIMIRKPHIKIGSSWTWHDSTSV